MKLVSIAERKQFRICKVQKHKNTKTQKCKITKERFSERIPKLIWGRPSVSSFDDGTSSKMRVSERNETCFNCQTEAVSHLQNAKTQNYKNAKMQKGAKSIFPIYKENAYILQRINEYGKP